MNNKEDFVTPIDIDCGFSYNSFEKLEHLCKVEADKLLPSINLPEKGNTIVNFWTKDIPELIGKAVFEKDDNGNITYYMDFSESTL